MTSSFAPLLGELQAVFDDPATRTYPLARRTPVTDALEHMLYEAIRCLSKKLSADFMQRL